MEQWNYVFSSTDGATQTAQLSNPQRQTERTASPDWATGDQHITVTFAYGDLDVPSGFYQYDLHANYLYGKRLLTRETIQLLPEVKIPE